MSFPQYDFFGVPVSLFSDESLKSFLSHIDELKTTNILYGFSLHSIYSISNVPEIIKLGKEADIIVTDGRPFHWLLKFFNVPVKSNISIPESVMLSLKAANDNKFSILLFGSTEEINLQASYNIEKNYPNIDVFPGINGYFGESEIDNKIEAINALNPDIVLIGISSPIKERLAFKYKERYNAKLLIPCGGMIDVLAGKAKMTPPIIKKLGLASFYRIFQEPSRLLADRLKFYTFVFLSLIPVLLWYVVIQKRKDFSLLKYYE